MELKNLKKKEFCDRGQIGLLVHSKSTIYNLTMKEAIYHVGKLLRFDRRLSSFGWLKAGATVRGMKGLLNNVFARIVDMAGWALKAVGVSNS